MELGLEATDFAKTSVTLICVEWKCQVVVDGVSWGISDVIANEIDIEMQH